MPRPTGRDTAGPPAESPVANQKGAAAFSATITARDDGEADHHGGVREIESIHGGKVRSAGVRADARHVGEDGCPAGFQPGDRHPRR
jgi:hypothetical protein